MTPDPNTIDRIEHHARWRGRRMMYCDGCGCAGLRDCDHAPVDEVCCKLNSQIVGPETFVLCECCRLLMEYEAEHGKIKVK